MNVLWGIPLVFSLFAWLTTPSGAQRYTAPAAPSETYRLQALPFLPSAINNTGTIVGTLSDWGVVSQNGRLIALPYPYPTVERNDVFTSAALKISDNGIITGIMHHHAYPPSLFRWGGPGTPLVRNFRDPGWPTGVNERGVIVGDSDHRAILWRNDTSPTFYLDGETGWPRDLPSMATGINNKGEIIWWKASGTLTTSSFLRDINGKMTELGHFLPQAINDKSQIAGTWEGVAYRLQVGFEPQLFGKVGESKVEVMAMDENGTFVGKAPGTWGGAFISSEYPRKLVQLEKITTGDGEWILTEARDLNDAGVIVGVGIYQGVERGFRLDPILPRTIRR